MTQKPRDMFAPCLLFLHSSFAELCQQTGVWDKVAAVSQSALRFSCAAVFCLVVCLVWFGFWVFFFLLRVFFSRHVMREEIGCFFF